MQPISRLSSPRLKVPISGDLAGITALPVSLCVLPAGREPRTSDWTVGDWVVDATGTYARVALGSVHFDDRGKHRLWVNVDGEVFPAADELTVF